MRLALFGEIIRSEVKGTRKRKAKAIAVKPKTTKEAVKRGKRITNIDNFLVNEDFSQEAMLQDFTETSERPKKRKRKDSEDEESEYSASDSCDSDTNIIEALPSFLEMVVPVHCQSFI
jgi:hypothetical protein